MKTELTEHNIKSFFFEQVQQKLLEDKIAKKRKAVKRGEAIPSNWRGKCLNDNVKNLMNILNCLHSWLQIFWVFAHRYLTFLSDMLCVFDRDKNDIRTARVDTGLWMQAKGPHNS